MHQIVMPQSQCGVSLAIDNAISRSAQGPGKYKYMWGGRIGGYAGLLLASIFGERELQLWVQVSFKLHIYCSISVTSSQWLHSVNDGHVKQCTLLPEGESSFSLISRLAFAITTTCHWTEKSGNVIIFHS